MFYVAKYSIKKNEEQVLCDFETEQLETNSWEMRTYNIIYTYTNEQAVSLLSCFVSFLNNTERAERVDGKCSLAEYVAFR